MKIVKCGLYRVTYQDSGGADHFRGRWILSQPWLMEMIESGKAMPVRVS